MNAIRIHRKLDSDNLYLPELRPLIGKTVEIIILEEGAAIPSTRNWNALETIVRQIKDYDFEAQREQDKCDLRDAKEYGQ